jgi:hypothetical protein
MRGNVGEHRCRRQAFLESERVRKRLQRRSRLPRRHDTIDRATVRGVEVVPRTFPREPLATCVVEDDHGNVRGAVPIELGPLAADDSGDIRLQPGVDRRLDAIGSFRPDGCKNSLDEVPGRERRLELREGQMLIGRFARLFGGDQSGGLHPPQHGTLPRESRLRISVRIESGRTLRKARQERCLRRREHRRVVTEVRVTRPSRADHLIAVRREVQVQRQDLVLGKAMLQALREYGFLKLAAQRSRTRR